MKEVWRRRRERLPLALFELALFVLPIWVVFHPQAVGYLTFFGLFVYIPLAMLGASSVWQDYKERELREHKPWYERTLDDLFREGGGIPIGEHLVHDENGVWWRATATLKRVPDRELE